MLDTKILSNIDIKQEWLDELQELFPELALTIANTNASLPAVWNPYHNSYWGDFNWIRDIIGDADIRCFVTKHKNLVSSGITGHFGMYDVVDKDFNYDFYMGLPTSLDKRARTNGFQSNFVWIFVHECLHGMEKNMPHPDRTHEMEKQGRLLELLEDHRTRYNKLSREISLLRKIINSLYAKFNLVSPTSE